MWPFKKRYKTYKYFISYAYSHASGKKIIGMGRCLMSAACMPDETLFTIFEDDIKEEKNLGNVTVLSMTLLEDN